MEIPPPSVPDSRLTDWRQTDRTVGSPFSTRFVSVHTHTLVYEETAQRTQIANQTGIDHPWRFFFASRVRLDPPQSPNPMLTSLVRRQVSSAFVDRLSERGFEEISESEKRTVTIGDIEGVRYQYQAECRLAVEQQVIELPVEGYLAVWVDDDYHIAGGAYPATRPDSGPPDLLSTLTDRIDPDTAREELLTLIDACGER